MSNTNPSFSTLPPLPSHLPHSLSRAEWLPLVRADQQRRWRHGERVLVEEYLTRWPTLAEDVEGLLDLIYGEVLLREESGESVTVDEYVRRFPTHEASLKRQFDLHRALAAGSLLEVATSGNGTSPPTRPPSEWTKPPVPPAPADTSHASATGDKTPGESFAPPTVGGSGSPATAEKAPREESRAGRYLLYDEIGRGGMGAVLRGHDPGLRREVALKVLLERHSGEPGVAGRFVEEAQIAGQLQHPSVVPVYELGSFEDGRPYFAMKLVKGRTLAALLKERPSPADERPRFLKIFEQVCQAVAYAHSKGVIHRDLKPANVMVGAFGEVQVMDWGLAKVLGRPVESQPEEGPGGTVVRTVRSGTSAAESRPGSVMGTPAYMPPEQALGRRTGWTAVATCSGWARSSARS
jgi:hypothetical protein